MEGVKKSVNTQVNKKTLPDVSSTNNYKANQHHSRTRTLLTLIDKIQWKLDLVEKLVTEIFSTKSSFCRAKALNQA